MATEQVRAAAEHAQRLGEELAELVGQKQLAYGDAAGLQAGLWRVLLEQFAEGDAYVVPQRFMEYDVPRLTRVFDRVARIIARAQEGGDAMGESPWRDLAGDAIVGASVQARRTEPVCTATHPQTGHGCERADAHGKHDEHRYAHAGGVVRWTYNEAPTDGVCGAVDPETGRVCTLPKAVHPNGHRHWARHDAEHPSPHGWPWDPERDADTVARDNETYTHGYVPGEE